MRCLTHSAVRKSIDYFVEVEEDEKPTAKVLVERLCEVDSKRYRDRSRNSEQHGGAELLYRYRSHHDSTRRWTDYRYAHWIHCVFDVCRGIDGPSSDAGSFDDTDLSTHTLL